LELHEYLKTVGNLESNNLDERILPSRSEWMRLFDDMKTYSGTTHLNYNIWGINYIYRNTRVDPTQDMPTVVRRIAPGQSMMTMAQLADRNLRQNLLDEERRVEQQRRDQEYAEALEAMHQKIAGLRAELARQYEAYDSSSGHLTNH
jgi:hypothetical protein